MNFHQIDRVPGQLREMENMMKLFGQKESPVPLAAIDFAFALEALYPSLTLFLFLLN